MTVAEYKTNEGYTLRVFSSMYVDWGLEILDAEGESVYYSPHALSNESYGSTEDEDTGEIIEWTTEQWVDCLKYEADELLEAFLPEND